MTKRQWFLVAGTLVLAACSGTVSGICETTGEAGIVECTDVQTNQPAEAPVPTIVDDEPSQS